MNPRNPGGTSRLSESSSMRFTSAGLLRLGIAVKSIPDLPLIYISPLIVTSPNSIFAPSGAPASPERNRPTFCCACACISNALPWLLLHFLHVNTRSLPPSPSGGTCSILSSLETVSSSMVNPSRHIGQRYQSSFVGRTSSLPCARNNARSVAAPVRNH